MTSGPEKREKKRTAIKEMRKKEAKPMNEVHYPRKQIVILTRLVKKVSKAPKAIVVIVGKIE